MSDEKVKTEKVKKEKGKKTEHTFVLHDAEGKDTGRVYKGAPVAAARRAWRKLLKRTGKQVHEIKLRERTMEGSTRRLHVYKLLKVKEAIMPNDEKTPEWLRGRKILTPVFDKGSIEHMERGKLEKISEGLIKPKEKKEKKVKA